MPDNLGIIRFGKGRALTPTLEAGGLNKKISGNHL